MGIKHLAYETKGEIKGHAFRSLEKSNGKDTITGH
jgi:phosphopentomutase